MIDLDPVFQAALHLAPLPASASRLIAVLQREDWDLHEVVDIIRLDQALTGRLLRMANSAESGSRAAIGDIDAAVMRTGPGAVLSLVLGTSIRAEMVDRGQTDGLGEGELWRHSVAAALAVEKLTVVTRRRTPVETFAAALLHDVGRLVLGRFVDAEVRGHLERARREGGESLSGAESEVLAVHHGEIGALVAQHWDLPEGLVQAIQFHHDPESATTEEGRVLARFVLLADHAATRAGAGAGEHELEPEALDALLRSLNLSPEHLDELVEAVRDDLSEVLARFE